MKIVATIEARMTSTRLPGKVILPLAGKPVLERLVERVKRSKYVNEIVVATTINETDEPIIALCEHLHINYYRGSEDDVLQRVLNAAKVNKADIICELMGDSPFIDPILIDNVITSHLSGNYDYTSNFLNINTFPLGFAVQVFSLNVLERVASLTNDPIDHVHVSCFIYQNPQIFKLNGVVANAETFAPDIRLAIDTESDYELISKVFNELYKKNPEFSAKDIVKYLLDNPKLLFINKHIKSKDIKEG
jgi:spore coat polysaccharide biosynthesis protein SpsF